MYGGGEPNRWHMYEERTGGWERKVNRTGAAELKLGTRLATIAHLFLPTEVVKPPKPDGDDDDNTTEIMPTAESEV